MTSASTEHARSSQSPAPAASPTACVLLVGAEPVLLSYREQVLRWAGWSTLTRTIADLSPDGITPAPDLCVICHSLSQPERANLVQGLRSRWPRIKVLAITTGDIAAAEAGAFDSVVENLAGPVALIAEVRRQVEPSA